MDLKSSNYYIQIFLFTLFFFIWGVQLGQFENIDFLKEKYISNIRFSYFIIFLLIPIFYNLIKLKSLSLNKIFNFQKKIMYLVTFISLHYVFTKIFYGEYIVKSEVINLIYLLLLSIIYTNYREFLSNNFKKIILFYLFIFVFFSLYDVDYKYNTGQCNVNFFLIDYLKSYFNIYLTNSFYLENSHLAMMMVGVFFSSILILLTSKKKNYIFLSLFIFSILITLNNLSTTFFVSYFICQIFLLIFFYNKINYKFWIVSIIFLFINSYLFLSDRNCTIKLTEFSGKDILEENLEKRKNLTTQIYERSFMVGMETLRYRPLGWGIDGMDDATYKFLDKPLIKTELLKNEKVYHGLRLLNIKDGLSNFFKMISEFGIFTFILFYFFIRYLFNLKNINSYNIFIILLFITLSIRGVGYFSGGFIFCIFEFFYLKKKNNEFKQTFTQ